DGRLAGTEGVHLGLQALSSRGELLLLLLEIGMLLAQVLDLTGETGTAGQGLAGEVLPSLFEGGTALALQFSGLLLELLDLELDPLAGGCDVSHPTANLLQEFELLLV